MLCADMDVTIPSLLLNLEGRFQILTDLGFLEQKEIALTRYISIF